MLIIGLTVVQFLRYRWNQYISVYAIDKTLDIDILHDVLKQEKKRKTGLSYVRTEGLRERKTHTETKPPSSLTAADAANV